MLVASNSESDLPIFPHFSCASKHDPHGFLHAFFRMKSFLPDYKISKLLLDSTHDAMPYYEYCRRANITPFIDLNGKGGVKLPYKNDFTIGKDGVPVCKEGRRMNHNGSEPSKYRQKFRCPLASIIFTFQNTLSEFRWHNHSRFREIINIDFSFPIYQKRH